MSTVRPTPINGPVHFALNSEFLITSTRGPSKVAAPTSAHTGKSLSCECADIGPPSVNSANAPPSSLEHLAAGCLGADTDIASMCRRQRVQVVAVTVVVASTQCSSECAGRTRAEGGDDVLTWRYVVVVRVSFHCCTS